MNCRKYLMRKYNRKNKRKSAIENVNITLCEWRTPPRKVVPRIRCGPRTGGGGLALERGQCRTVKTNMPLEFLYFIPWIARDLIIVLHDSRVRRRAIEFRFLLLCRRGNKSLIEIVRYAISLQPNSLPCPLHPTNGRNWSINWIM